MTTRGLVSLHRENTLHTAMTLSERGRYARALAERRRRALNGDSDPDLLLQIAELHVKVLGFREALAAFELAGSVLVKSGRIDDAFTAYRKALDAAGRSARLDERAVRVARALAELHRQEGTPFNLLALFVPLERRLAREGSTRAALAVMRLVVEMDPEGTPYRRVFADALARGGDVDAAVTELLTCAKQLIARGVNDEAMEVVDRIEAIREEARLARGAAE